MRRRLYYTALLTCGRVPGIVVEQPVCRQSCITGGLICRNTGLWNILYGSPESGTCPEQIVSVALSLGLDALLSQDLGIDDLKRSVESGVQVIIAAHAWNGYEETGRWMSVTPPSWKDTREDGHYMVVIGVGSRNVYLEDLSLFGTRGVIQIDEFISRRINCRDGSNPGDPRVRYHYSGIYICGEKPAVYPEYTRV